VRDNGSPALHRLRMATLGLIVADNQQRRIDAERIWNAVTDISARTKREEVEKARASVVFHTAFGDLDLAVHSATHLVDTERADGRSAAFLRALRWSSIPLKFIGDKRGALASLTEAYGTAERLALTGEMWHTAEYMTELAFECDDTELATEWAMKCGEIAATALPNPAETFLTKCLLSRLALMTEDPARAAALNMEARRASPGAILRTRALETLLASETLVKLKLGCKRISTRTVSTLHRLHLRTRESGIRDYEAGALLTALWINGRAREGRTLHDEYIQRFRRSRLPLHSVIVKARELLYDT
jgi:hypothetical protein